MARKRDYQSIDEATAARLLSDYLPVARAWLGLYPHADDDELLSAARVAILDAYLTFDSERSSEATWMRRNIFWAMQGAAGAGFDKLGPKQSLDPSPDLVNGANPEQQFWQATAVRAIARLTPRRQVIISAWMKGETFEEIGLTIGISGSMAHREAQSALRELRDMLEDASMW